jgi:polyphosphate kinase 2 (PPK2 family)
MDAAIVPHLSGRQMRRIVDRYRVTSGKGFRLGDFDPSDTAGHLLTKADAEIVVTQDVHRLAALQDKLYAQNAWSLLCVLQAMDAAGKDSTIKHVMSGVNPQGVHVTSFKAPGPEELAHDFLWRREVRSASSIAAITRRSSSSASIPNSWRGSTCPRRWWANGCGSIASRRSPTSSAI